MDWIPSVIMVVLFLGFGVFAYFQWFKTYHLIEVKKGVLYRDGNRGMREFATALRTVHPKTVVMLVSEEEIADPKRPQFKEELECLEKCDITVRQFNIRRGGWPTNQDLAEFIKIVSNPANQPVLVHCAEGVRRTGIMVAAYQESVLGYDKTKVISQIETFGHSERLVRDISLFVKNYDPVNHKLNAPLPQSRE